MPNARVAGDVAFLRQLDGTPGPDLAAGVDPEVLWEVAAAVGYEAELGWSRAAADGSFDAVFRRPGASSVGLDGDDGDPRPWAELTNDPLRPVRHRKVAARIRGRLQAGLPDYMVPSALVLIDRLPRTPNGKVDRTALLGRIPSEPAVADGYVAPRTPLEGQLADLWAQPGVLGLDLGSG